MKSDIDQTCTDLPTLYAYYSERQEIWTTACRQALINIEKVDNNLGFLRVLETLLDDLYDPHISLNTNSDTSPRLVPSGTDIWIGDAPGGYAVIGVRPRSGAARAGVRPGDRVVSFNGMKPSDLIARRVHAKPHVLNAARENWALNAAIAGYRDEPRILVVNRNGVDIRVDLGDPEPNYTSHPLTVSTLTNAIGYIRFHNSLGNSETVTAFDEALAGLSQTRGLVLDLRDTPGGGNTAVAEPILGRLFDAKTPYQITIRPDAEPETRSITPRGPWIYTQPIVALVGRWTGSMGEGVAIGLDGAERAVIMGDCMAALAGGTRDLKLNQSGISIRIPAYDLTHLDGTPRHHWCVETPMIADTGDFEDDLLKVAIERLSVETY